MRVRVDRERERGKDIRIYIYIYTHICLLIYSLFIYIEREMNRIPDSTRFAVAVRAQASVGWVHHVLPAA